MGTDNIDLDNQPENVLVCGGRKHTRQVAGCDLQMHLSGCPLPHVTAERQILI